MFVIYLKVSVSMLFFLRSFIVMFRVSLIGMLTYKFFMSSVRNLDSLFLCSLWMSSANLELAPLNSHFNVTSSLSLWCIYLVSL
jgi:hypothetical protein